MPLVVEDSEVVVLVCAVEDSEVVVCAVEDSDVVVLKFNFF